VFSEPWIRAARGGQGNIKVARPANFGLTQVMTSASPTRSGTVNKMEGY